MNIYLELAQINHFSPKLLSGEIRVKDAEKERKEIYES